ncbi:MAG: FHA domain-containing protein [Planctomycetota bacterium]|nr:FHA domain-containing protein [Planctomycetota bacterium]MCZ6611625.1 FHA domain-containing protein [Planctomycetota bacterium]
MPSIIIVAGSNEGDYYPLGKRTMVAGRDEAVPIQIVDELVSRKHLQIRLEQSDGRYRALDMKSANGVFVNGRQIASETVLEDGDMIQIGNSKLMFTNQDFPDRESAMAHYHQQGERGKSTLIR